MKATLWLCSVVTAMLTQSIYATPLIHYQYSYPSKSLYKENVLTEMKRTKPSLSIVNPLDVLRQRLLLEIARRHMQENSRQVEKNRMILKTVGKRSEGMGDDEDEAGAEFADWQRMRVMPQLNSQSHGWPRIHRSGYQRPLSAYDLFQEMDLRNHRSINRQLNAENDMELDPNRSDAAGAAAAGEEQSPLADYGEDEKNNQSSGLNI